MRNKRFIILILIMFLCLLSLILLFSFLRLFIPKKNTVTQKKKITNKYVLDNVNTLSFDFKKADVFFSVSDIEEMIIIQNKEAEKFFLSHNEIDGKIFFEEDNYIISPHKRKYTIILPEDYSGVVNINNGFGGIDIDGINNDIFINNNSGNLNFKKTKNVNLMDISGNAFFKDVYGNITFYSTAGDIEIDNMKGILNIETISGNIKINDYNTTGDSKIINFSGDTVLTVTKDSICKIDYQNETGKTFVSNKICNSNFNIINIKNVTGEISVN